MFMDIVWKWPWRISLWERIWWLYYLCQAITHHVHPANKASTSTRGYQAHWQYNGRFREFPILQVATHDDKLLYTFCDEPRMSPQDEDEEMWFEVDRKLYSTLGNDNYSHNLMQGSLGLELAMIYISKARDQPKWTLDPDMLVKILDATIAALVWILLGIPAKYSFRRNVLVGNTFWASSGTKTRVFAQMAVNVWA